MVKVGDTVAYTASEGKVYPAFVNRVFWQDYKGQQKQYAALTVFGERGPEVLPVVGEVGVAYKMVAQPDGSELPVSYTPTVGSFEAHGAFSALK